MGTQTLRRLHASANAIPDYAGDFAIVQSNNFSTLFILSRKQHPEDSVLDVSAT